MSATTETTKRCTRCNELRLLAQFYVRNTGQVYSTCKPCENRRAREYRAFGDSRDPMKGWDS